MGHTDAPGQDWGERSRRWAGVVSRVHQVDGMEVHYLRAEPSRRPGEPTTHLLLHPMGAGSWSWLDVVAPLATGGRVIVPDLPGAGRTRPADPRDARAENSPEFLEGLCRALDLDRVVVHGHSLGGLAGTLFAARHPTRVSRLVLTSPVLPGSPDPPRFPRAWRLALGAAPTVARVPVRIALRVKGRAWRRWQADPTDPALAERMFRGSVDVTQISPDLLTLLAEEVERVRLPWRVDGMLQAAASAVAALTVKEEAVRAELDRIRAPTLVLWGRHDTVLPRALCEELRQSHPEWTVTEVEGVGHLLPWEAPTTYVELVRDWMTQ
ncbi:alpha/beta fold hydrolase [Nostocoides sp. F2B08]|uniref:alpha/beta fold hydrolase n=1 Tax=Nostocoides sp. F2B08 TaxID=2653936 RepID=UPI001D0420AE|nr:alpha/beta hydrolase [Tetrasphaera sp. F2B08]